MTLFKEMSDDRRREYIFPCDCHDWHYLRFAWDEDPKYRTLWVEESYRGRLFKDKMKMIWSVLRGRPACFTEILLDEKTVKLIQEVMNQEFTSKD